MFATLPGREALQRYESIRSDKPPEDWAAEVEVNLGRNEDLRKWMMDYFRDTPVLYENGDARRYMIFALSQVRAEWALRLFVELSQDKRPVRSEKYSPKEIDEMAIEDDGGFTPEINAVTAGARSSDISYAGLPDASVLKEKGLCHADWLYLPAQWKRLPEIVRSSWGEGASLNAEIGLGPDNKPLAGSGAQSGGKFLGNGGTGRAGVGKQWAAQGEPLAGTTSPGTEGGPLPRWITAASTLLLVLGGYFAFRRKPASS